MTHHKSTQDPHKPTRARTVEIDLQAFVPMLNDVEASDEQKLDLLSELWTIMVMFAEMGFGLHPAQQAVAASEACGKLPNTNDPSPESGKDVVHSSHSEKPAFERAARTVCPADAEGVEA